MPTKGPDEKMGKPEWLWPEFARKQLVRALRNS